jgi:hypothetical protein
MEKAATPSMLQNWRFQQALYRAYFDATDRSRLIAETEQEETALEYLRKAPMTGSIAAIKKAEEALAKPDLPPASDTRARVFELAEALFQSIHMQLSVPRYDAIAVWRGANLDLIDFPLNNAPWMNKRFAQIVKIPDEASRLKEINKIINWTNPGPGGFYDDLGKQGSEPHLVPGSVYSEDPAFIHAPMKGMEVREDHSARISSCTYAETLHELVYGPETKCSIKLVANDSFEIQAMQPKNMNYEPLEFDIPAEATRSGKLKLTWSKPPGLGGNGRGVQVAEVWLMRNQDMTPRGRDKEYEY